MMIRKRDGFTLVEIMIVVAIIGVLAAIAIPSFQKSREITRRNACINNLRLIDGAKEQWAMAEDKADDEAVNAADEVIIMEYIRGGAPDCPEAGTYTVGNIGADPVCSETAKGHELP